MREKWLFWCGLNSEQELLENILDSKDFVSIKGSTPVHLREDLERKWRTEDVPIMITKASVFGFGMNWQHCQNMVFVGLSDSFEAMYQAVRRCWRFGQKKPVNVHIVISEKEGSVVENIRRKERQAAMMQQKMVEHMADLSKAEINDTGKNTIKYESKQSMEVPEWLLTNKLAKTG